MLQPLDVSINKPMEAYFRMAWAQYMLQHQSNQQIKKPTKQHIVDWIEQANSMPSPNSCNSCIVKEAFLVTGLSNILGGHEDNLIRDNTAHKEIDEILVTFLERVGFSQENIILILFLAVSNFEVEQLQNQV